MVGALAATRLLPLDRESFKSVITQTMPAGKVAVNLTAFEQGQKVNGD